jgi:hypothetical protein
LTRLTLYFLGMFQIMSVLLLRAQYHLCLCSIPLVSPIHHLLAYKVLTSQYFPAAALSLTSFFVACYVYHHRAVNGRENSNELAPDSAYFKAVHYFLQIALLCSSGAFFVNIVIVSMVKSHLDSRLELRWGNVVCFHFFASTLKLDGAL